MGAEREDTDLNPKRVGTEPGLGKQSGATPAAAAGHERPAVPADDGPSDDPAPVDFDALHAALGDPLDYEDMSSGPAVEAGEGGDDGEDFEQDSATPVPAHGVARVGESSGRSSATYSSARPHTIPPTLLPVEDLNAPPVIVADDNATVPSAPPQMTVPLSATPHAAQYGGAPGAPPGGQGQRGSNPMLLAHGPNAQHGGHGQAGQPGSGPHAAAGGPQGPHDPASASNAHTPQPFPAIQRSGNPQMTMRMPERPLNPRRGKTPTVVVRPRGPSTKQKLVAFMAMLLLVTACGIAVIIWRKPKLLGLDPLLGTPSAAPAPTTSGSGGSLGPSGAGSATGAGAAAASGVTMTPVSPSAVASAIAAASAGAAPSAAKSKPIKVAPAAPPAPPATTH